MADDEGRGGGEAGGDEVKEEVLREAPLKHMKENTENEELEGGKGKKRWKWRRGVGGDNHLYFVIQRQGGCSGPAFYMRREGGREGSGEEHCSSAPSILWEHFDRQSSVLKGNLLLAGSEEAVYRRACLI